MTQTALQPFPLDFASKCSVCLDFFGQTRKSKMLPCRHVACLPCLMKIEEHGAIKCPICRKVHSYTVTQLPTSEITEDILKVQTNFSDLMSYLPEKEGGKRSDTGDEGPLLLSSFRSLFDFMKKMLPTGDHHIFQRDLGHFFKNATESTTGKDAINWIEKQTFGPVQLVKKNVVPLIRILGAAIFDWCLAGRSSDEQEIVLRRWVPIFHHFIANEKYGSMFVVFTIQDYLALSKQPEGMMVRILAVLCENEKFFPMWNREGIKDSQEFAEIIVHDFNL